MINLLISYKKTSRLLTLLIVFSTSYAYAGIPEYPVEGHWPYGSSYTSETWSDEAHSLLLFSEGTVLRIADVSNPTNISVISEIRTKSPIWYIDISSDGSMAAVSDRLKFITLINIQNPSAPQVLDIYEAEDGRLPFGLAFVDNTVLVAAMSPIGLRSFDISNPNNITVLGNYMEPGTNSVFDVEVLGNYVFIADDGEGVSVINISDPSSLTLATRFSAASNASHISISGTTAYVSRRSQGISILSLDVNQNPPIITDLGTIDPHDFPAGNGLVYRAIMADNGLLLAADLYNENGLVLMDVSDPSSPIIYHGDSLNPGYALSVLGNISFSSTPSGSSPQGIKVHDLNQQIAGIQQPPVELDFLPLFSNSTDVDMSGTSVIVSAPKSGMVVIDASNPQRPVASSWFPHNKDVVSAVEINNTVAIASNDRNLYLVDVSDMSSPVQIGALEFESGTKIIHIEDAGNNVAVMSAGFNGVKWVDLSDPNNPVEIASWNDQGFNNITRVVVKDGIVGAFAGSNAWLIKKPADSNLPNTIGSFTLNTNIVDADINGEYLYIANFTDGVRIWDIANTDNIHEVADISAFPIFLTANGVKVHDGIVYIAGDSRHGLVRFDVSDPTNPVFLSVETIYGNAKKVDMNDELLAVAALNAGVKIWSNIVVESIFKNGFESHE